MVRTLAHSEVLLGFSSFSCCYNFWISVKHLCLFTNPYSEEYSPLPTSHWFVSCRVSFSYMEMFQWFGLLNMETWSSAKKPRQSSRIIVIFPSSACMYTSFWKLKTIKYFGLWIPWYCKFKQEVHVLIFLYSVLWRN